MRAKKWLRIGLPIAGIVAALLAIEVFSSASILYRIRTEINLTAVSGQTGVPVEGARVVPVWSNSQQVAPDTAAEITDSDGVARIRLDLSFCRAAGLIGSIFFRDRPSLAYVPYDFRIEHPQFKFRLLSVTDPAASWLLPQQLPNDLDAMLVFRQVALQPLGAQ